MKKELLAYNQEQINLIREFRRCEFAFNELDKDLELFDYYSEEEHERIATYQDGIIKRFGKTVGIEDRAELVEMLRGLCK